MVRVGLKESGASAKCPYSCVSLDLTDPLLTYRVTPLLDVIQIGKM